MDYETPYGMYKLIEQAAESYAVLIDEGVRVVVKPRPGWMPYFIYRRLVRSVAELQLHAPLTNNK